MKNRLWIVALVFAFASCQKTIKIPSPTYAESVSIQGIVEPDSMAEVFLFKTVPYFDKLARASELFIRNATVVITSIDGTDNLKVDSVFDYINCEYVPFYKGTILIKKMEEEGKKRGSRLFNMTMFIWLSTIFFLSVCTSTNLVEVEVREEKGFFSGGRGSVNNGVQKGDPARVASPRRGDWAS